LDPFAHLESSNEKNHCLQFWYSIHGQSVGKVTIVYNETNDNQIEDSFTFNSEEQGRFIINNSSFFLNSNCIDTNWKQIQRTISNDNDYELIF